MGAVMTYRLAWFHVNRMFLWLVPAGAGLVVTAYLSWGAWVTAHDPEWLRISPVWWRAELRPTNDTTLLTAVLVWLVAWAAFWWPRRKQSRTVGLITIAAMVAVGAALGTSALAPCRGGETKTSVVAGVLGLYVGNPPAAYGNGNVCPGQAPLALQLGQIICLGATLIGAVGAAATLWREPLARIRARFVKDAAIFTGLDSLTMPLLQRLAETGRPDRIVVIEPDGSHPLLEEARATGAHVMVGNPTAERILLPIITGWRGCALSYVYAVRNELAENEAVLDAVTSILSRRYRRPDPEHQPHLVVRIDDPRHADHWRGWNSGISSHWFADVLCPHESTATALADQIVQPGVRQLLLCGDSSLALAALLELGHRAWERHELTAAAHPALNGQGPAPFPVDRVILLSPQADALRREYLAASSPSVVAVLPTVVARPGRWQDQLLPLLDGLPVRDAAASMVAIVDGLAEDTMHEAGRVARLHSGIPVFVLTSDGAGMSDAIFDQLHPFQRALLIDGEVPEDTWTRMARHWHECYRLSHPPTPEEPQAPGRRPWPELGEFLQQDNILQLRSIMTAVVERGRRWVPLRSVLPGSIIELSDRELEEIARAEHTRWYRRRLAAGWSPGGPHHRPRAARSGHNLINSRVVPWSVLPDRDRQGQIDYLRGQLARLEGAGFVPVVPAGGPPYADRYERIGLVRARKLQSRRTWTRRSGDRLTGNPGDWRVLDEWGDERTVRETEFLVSYEHVDGERWRRVGTYLAWQVREPQVLRTIEGRAMAQSGDWVVEGYGGERWPVTDDQFRRTYRPAPR
jgi:Trk K+ transport system NAD-binding subunit